MVDTGIRLVDSYTLEYARERVWEQLNDPGVLAACIRGCAYVERDSQHDFRAVIRARVGEIHKDFHVDLVVDDTHAPAAYTLSTQMGAGLLGSVSGVAEVELTAMGVARTHMVYRADISGTRLVGRVLPLVEGVAQRRVREFFDQFVAHLGESV